MTYVMSDLHGEYEKYLQMLEKIKFSEQDTLFILGDVCDRGEHPIEILFDMMNRPNVYPIMGNHDWIALYLLEKLTTEITEESISHLSFEEMQDMLAWIDDGGNTTVAGFQKLSHEDQENVLDYLKEFSLWECIDVGEKTFILIHAGLGNFRKNKKLTQYTPEELLLTRQSPNVRYFDDDTIYIITGHTPTYFLSGKSEIYQNCNNICIDCGACFEGGRLACLCLDTMEEFYI